jgi:hypothetical protein
MHIWPNVCCYLFFEKREERFDMEVDHNYASKGVANAGLTTGIIGTTLGALNSGIFNGGLFGGGMGNCANANGPMVSRYELGLEQKIADLTADKKLLEADRYTDNKTLELYTYVDGRLRNIEAQICNQAVVNAQITANISCMQNSIAVLDGLTKTIIPISNVCPAPMPQYNSWTAPTATT